jgi:small-conductance mechanosensitive channel
MIIQIGSPEHNAHLIGVERDRLIAENQPEIQELKEQLKTAGVEYKTATPEELTAINKQKEVADINRQIRELENPEVSKDFLIDSRQSVLDYPNQAAFSKPENKTYDFQNGVNLAKAGLPLPVNSSQATKDGFNSVTNQ